MTYNAKDVFERMAPVYDTPERAEMAQTIAGAIRGELQNTQGKTALDYGCGTGLVGLALADQFASLLLVDTSPQMVAQVQKKLEDAPIANGKALCADFQQEIPPGIRADYVLMSQVLLHVPDAQGLLGRLHGVLNPGGHLIVVDFDTNQRTQSDLVHNGFDQALLRDALAKLGFASAQSHTFYHGKKIFMNQDASLFLLHAVKGE